MIGPITGPGSQPTDFDGGALEYMVMPDTMRIFSSALVPEADEAQDTPDGVAAGDAILAALRRVAHGGAGETVDLSHLDADNLAFVDQLLGEGEVSVVLGADLQAQESVLAGVWRLRATIDGRRRDTVEIGAFPASMQARAFATARAAALLPQTAREGVFNAPPLVAEINEALAHTPAFTSEGPHVINLSLLPHTEGDIDFLDEALGRGDLIILSRGYGNCRIHATATRNVWWVRYFNSQDTLILHTIEVSPLPAVAMAAAEDLHDSVERLAEIMAIYR
ncbi:hydrogenase expression/formation protein [Novosphingobium sp. FSY-8]|uniref:Hydrogenase expression/formation protein n=1 Tax=Novosphingobium ovatum TaxID=1908523 RepID=A0ABW9X9M0_9SPHN|nr:hydrogenase expression/formation protein [Novosphingobium ovatum]NBC35230.1 hydrogenase expression/formation protein [Novosphingobium ovatum]